MIQTITQIGHQQAVILDDDILASAHLHPGDQVSVEVADSGTITVTPLRQRDVSHVIDDTLTGYAGTLQKLA